MSKPERTPGSLEDFIDYRPMECVECGGEVKNEGGNFESLGIEIIHVCQDCGIVEGAIIRSEE